jgi:hypothetical protein
MYGRVAQMKGHLALVPISPFGIADIFQSTNNLSSKVAYVHGAALGQDIQEVLPSSIENEVTIVFLEQCLGLSSSSTSSRDAADIISWSYSETEAIDSKQNFL